MTYSWFHRYHPLLLLCIFFGTLLMSAMSNGVETNTTSFLSSIPTLKKNLPGHRLPLSLTAILKDNVIEVSLSSTPKCNDYFLKSCQWKLNLVDTSVQEVVLSDSINCDLTDVLLRWDSPLGPLDSVCTVLLTEQCDDGTSSVLQHSNDILIKAVNHESLPSSYDKTEMIEEIVSLREDYNGLRNVSSSEEKSDRQLQSISLSTPSPFLYNVTSITVDYTLPTVHNVWRLFIVPAGNTDLSFYYGVARLCDDCTSGSVQITHNGCKQDITYDVGIFDYTNGDAYGGVSTSFIISSSPTSYPSLTPSSNPSYVMSLSTASTYLNNATSITVDYTIPYVYSYWRMYIVPAGNTDKSTNYGLAYTCDDCTSGSVQISTASLSENTLYEVAIFDFSNGDTYGGVSSNSFMILSSPTSYPSLSPSSNPSYVMSLSTASTYLYNATSITVDYTFPNNYNGWRLFIVPAGNTDISVFYGVKYACTTCTSGSLEISTAGLSEDTLYDVGVFDFFNNNAYGGASSNSFMLLSSPTSYPSFTPSLSPSFDFSVITSNVISHNETHVTVDYTLRSTNSGLKVALLEEGTTNQISVLSTCSNCVTGTLSLPIPSGIEGSFVVSLIDTSSNNDVLSTSVPFIIAGSPSSHPSTEPSSLPSVQPSFIPSFVPSVRPSLLPSSFPSNLPSVVPSDLPSYEPSVVPSYLPSYEPSGQPSFLPSFTPSDVPTNSPSLIPSSQPSTMPSPSPTDDPSTVPSMLPSLLPTELPSSLPSFLPSLVPSTKPSKGPSFLPSLSPTMCEASMTPSDQQAVYIVTMFKDNDELSDENVASIETLTVTFLQPIVAPDICNLTLTVKVLSSTSIDLGVSFLLLYTFQYICDVNTDGYNVLYQGLMNNLNEYDTYIQTDLLLDQVTFNFEDNPVDTDDVEAMVLAVDLSMEITEAHLSVLTTLTIDFLSKYASADVYDIALDIIFDDVDSETTALNYQFSVICETGVSCASPLIQVLSDNFDEYTTIVLNDEQLFDLMNVASLSLLSEEEITSVTMEANNAPDRQLSDDERQLLSTLTETFTQPLNSASMQITGVDVTSNTMSGQRNLQGNIVYITIRVKAMAISTIDLADEITTFMERNALEYMSLIKGDGGLGSIDGTYFYSASINLLLSTPSSIPSQYPYVNATYVDTNEGTIDPSSLSGAIGGAAAAAAAAAASSSSSSDSDSDSDDNNDDNEQDDDKKDDKKSEAREEKEKVEVEVDINEDENDEDEDEGLEYEEEEDDEDDQNADDEDSLQTNHSFRSQARVVMACLKLLNRRVWRDDIAQNLRVHHSKNEINAAG